MEKRKTGLKIIIFIVIAAVLFCGICYLLRPVWSGDRNYSTVHGFYKEPDNTIETLFLGSSVVYCGISPMELYETYGICSYNLGTGAQPMMTSYYWMEEVYRLHSETLDTVVLDVSELKETENRTDPYYIKAFEDMKFSKVKYHFIKDFSKNFTEFASYLLPVLAFHERWKELSKSDFLEYQLPVKSSDRGYELYTDVIVEEEASYTDISVPSYVDEDTTETRTDSEDLLYFQKIVEFCDSQDIQLVLIKTPQQGANSWSDTAHNTVQSLADQYGLDFVDFNYEPYIDEIDFNFAVDTFDNIHMNYYGTSKYTDWLGNYLMETCANRDVRGESKYTFMEDELEEYHRTILPAGLAAVTDPAEYLSDLTAREDYAIFISVKDDASDSLTEEQREVFQSLGLAELSQLPSHASYLAVIDDGKVITEQTQEEDTAWIDSFNADETGEEALVIACDGRLPGRLSYSMESGGYRMGNISSIKIDGEEYSLNKRGLNIVVYDKQLKEVVDQACFDTFASPERAALTNEETLQEAIQSGGTASLSGSLRELYLYDRLCEDTKTAKELRQDIGKGNLSAYLREFMGNEEFDVYLSADGDIAKALSETDRLVLAGLGLTELSELDSGDSYLAVIQGGEPAAEQSGPDGETLAASGEMYSLRSEATEEEGGCSLLVQGTEYVGETQGLYIVIYDNILNRVVDETVYTIGKRFELD